MIIRRVGKVAYELDLPLLSKIHPVVHVSLLRPYLRKPSGSKLPDLPLNISNIFLQDQPKSESGTVKKQTEHSSKGEREKVILPDSDAILKIQTKAVNLKRLVLGITSTTNLTNETTFRVCPSIIYQP